MRVTWIVKVTPSILGPLVWGGRRPGRKFVPARELPRYVRVYMALPDDVMRRPVIEDVERIEDLDALPLDENLLKVTKRGCTRILTIAPEAPPSATPRPTVPRGVPAIRSLKDLCRFFSAESPALLNKRIYKGTDCGASISLYLRDGRVLHDGSRELDTLPMSTPLDGFTVQTIVEGSDAEVNSDLFRVPVAMEEVRGWIADMEAEADLLWREANEGLVEGFGRG